MSASTQGLSGKEIKTKTSLETKQELSGLWMGLVEDNFDPLGLGRLKVRVMAVHQRDKDNPTDTLRWAFKSEIYGGFYGGGSFINYPIGSKVWVMFLNGDPETPVVVGANHSIPYESQLYGHKRADDLVPIEPEDVSMGLWKGTEASVPDGSPNSTPISRGRPEIPEEAQESFGHEPTVLVAFKTPKGASLVVEERDEHESLELLDRGGAGLRMSSPVTKAKNRYNGMARGTKSAFKGAPAVDYEKDTPQREAELSLRDLAQQGVTMQARKHEEQVTLISRAANSRSTYEDPDETGSTQVIDLSAGGNRTMILGQVGGNVRFVLTFDANRGIIDIESDLAIRHKTKKYSLIAERIVLQGPVTIDGPLTVAKDLILGGKVVEGSPARDKPINYR